MTDELDQQIEASKASKRRQRAEKDYTSDKLQEQSTPEEAANLAEHYKREMDATGERFPQAQKPL